MGRAWGFPVVVAAGGCVRHDASDMVCARAVDGGLQVRALFARDAETGPNEASCVVEPHRDVLRVRTRAVVEVDRTPFLGPDVAVSPLGVTCTFEGVGELGAGEHVLVYRGEELRVSLPGNGEVQCFTPEVERGDVARQVFPEAFDTGVEIW